MWCIQTLVACRDASGCVEPYCDKTCSFIAWITEPHCTRHVEMFDPGDNAARKVLTTHTSWNILFFPVYFGKFLNKSHLFYAKLF